MAKRPIHLSGNPLRFGRLSAFSGNPLRFGRLSAWHNPNRDETKPQN